MPANDASAKLVQYIREKFLDGDPAGQLEETTPLLEYGVLNSLNIAMLLNFIRDELGVTIEAGRIDAQNFRDVRSIANLLLETSGAPPAA